MDEENEQDGYQPNFTEAATSPAMPPQPPQPPPAMAQQQQQPPPVPMWTAADDMRFARKSAGMNQVRDDLDAGVLHPQFAMPLLQQYQNDLQGMSQEKMAFDQHQQQTATQTALANAGLQRAVEQANQNHAADGFLGTMRTFSDPANGRDAHFYQARPGEWEQVNFRHSDPAPGGDNTGVDQYLNTALAGSGDNTGVDQYLAAAQGGQGAEQPAAPPAAQSPFTQTIWNGTHRTDTTWQPGQTQGTSTGDWRGIPGGQPPPAAQQPGGRYSPSDDELQGFRSIAAHATAGIQNPRIRDQEFGRIVAGLVSKHVLSKMADAKQQAIGDRQQKSLDAKEKAKQETEKQSLWDKKYNDHLTELQKEFDRVRDTKDEQGHVKPADPETYPDWAKAGKHPVTGEDLDPRQNMELEAERRADRDYQRGHGRLPDKRQSVIDQQKAAAAERARPLPPSQQPPIPLNRPAAGGVNAPLTTPGNHTVNDLDEAIKQKIATDPAAARADAWRNAHSQAQAATAALPPDANDEQKWLANRPTLTAPDLADLYDRHRVASLFDSGVGATRQASIDRDEQWIRDRAAANGVTPEAFKANLAHLRNITPQAVDRLNAQNRQDRSSAKQAGGQMQLDQKISRWVGRLMGR